MVFGINFIDVAVFIVSVTCIIFVYFKRSYQYWEKKGIPFITPEFPYGNIRAPSNVKEPEYVVSYRCYEELRAKGVKHGGIYSITKPLYVPVDLEYINNIITSDFHAFYNRSVYYNEKHDPLSVHLLSLEGQRWKNMRIKLTPAFTSGKMKTMMQTMLECGDQMVEAMAKIDMSSQAVDIKEAIACYGTDIIGSCAFGIDCNSFKDSDPVFRRYGRKFNQTRGLRRIGRLIAASFPNFSRLIGIPSIPREVSSFFMNMIRNNVDYRKRENLKRNDVLQILMDLHMQYDRNLDGNELENARRPLTIEEIAANAFLFFLAGFDTSSLTMSFLFYELSLNQEIQDNVRKEINEVLAIYDGEITYEALSQMKYVKQVINETLRKYPVLPLFKRMCTEDYKIPGTKSVLEKGTPTYISVLGLHRNPEYFPEPDKFDPDRFSDANKGKIKSGSYLGFGDGPRICIGKRFGMMQLTIALIKLVRIYKIKLNGKTISPLQFDPDVFILAPKGSVWLNLEKL